MSSQSALIKAQFKARRSSVAKAPKVAKPPVAASTKTPAVKKPSPPKPKTAASEKKNAIQPKAPIQKSTQLPSRIVPISASPTASSIASKIQSNGASPMGEARIIIEQISKSTNPKLNSSLLTALLEVELTAAEVYQLKLKEHIVGWKSRQRVYHAIANSFLTKLAQIDDLSIQGTKRKSEGGSAKPIEAKKPRIGEQNNPKRDSASQQNFKKRSRNNEVKISVQKKSQIANSPDVLTPIGASRPLPQRVSSTNAEKSTDFAEKKVECAQKEARLPPPQLKSANQLGESLEDDLNLSESSDDDSDDELEKLLEKSVVSKAEITPLRQCLPSEKPQSSQCKAERSQSSDSEQSDSDSENESYSENKAERENAQKTEKETTAVEIEVKEKKLGSGNKLAQFDLDNMFDF